MIFVAEPQRNEGVRRKENQRRDNEPERLGEMGQLVLTIMNHFIIMIKYWYLLVRGHLSFWLE